MALRGERSDESGEQAERARLREILVEYAKTRSEPLREELVLAHINIVRYLAARFVNRGEPLEDLIQVGCVGLLKAIDRFEPARGVEFITYAMPTILGEIKRHFRDKGWALRVPRRLQDLSLAVNRVSETLSVELGRSATVDDVALKLGATPEEVIEAQELGTAYCTLSLDAVVPGDQSKAATLADRVGSDDADFEVFENRESLRLACKALEPRERLVIHLRFFDEMSQADIARCMGVSQMQISRLQQRAIGKIRNVMQGEGVAQAPPSSPASGS